jgi:hypothetical protein
MQCQAVVAKIEPLAELVVVETTGYHFLQDKPESMLIVIGILHIEQI